ncbi:MAG: YggS family pyridoxal phosphate-dependent enzyme [Terriglobia bacterium]
MTNVSSSLGELGKRIEKAAGNVGRAPDEVSLVLVTKYTDTDRMAEAAAAGALVFGENRVQELVAKKERLEALGISVSWHFLGHLQRNKVKDIIGVVDLIQSVDSIRLIERIEEKASAAGVTQRVLLQVNLSEDDERYGLRPGELAGVLGLCEGFGSVKVEGLMTMAPLAGPDVTRQYFRKTRVLAEELRAQEGQGLEVLSMGMSNDFEVAIEEGSTMVRVGTAVFG